MRRLRNSCTGQKPVHFFWSATGVAAGALLGAAPLASAHAAVAAARPVQAASTAVGQSVDDFYRARAGAPLWLASKAGDAAEQLLSLLSTASLDGLSPDKYQIASLQQALETARSGKRKDIQRADVQLSAAFAAYVADLKQDPGVGMSYVDPTLRPTSPSPLASLLMAAGASSLTEYVRTMGWMHPFYGELRRALAEHRYTDEQQRQLLELNLLRSRVLPSGPQRYILVNAAQQRLYMYENRKPVDSMVVVVGKPKYPTPIMAAYVRYAALNPYWYVPADLVPEDVAQYVVKFGLNYLDDYGYEIVSDWTPNPTIIDPKTLDWNAINEGKVQINIRQKPGPKNFMGRMKFMFPNQFGVYLHDNPRRELFLKSARYFSGGCVRLEDAPRLGRWLFGHDLEWQGAGTEEPVPLAQPVPVYITYFTAMPDSGSIAYFEDVYGRDKAKLADETGGATTVATAAK